MSEGIPPREQHPISDESLQQAYDQNNGDEHNPDIDWYHNLLAEIQHTIELDYLGDLLNYAERMQLFELIREDDAGWTVADYERKTWTDILSEPGVQRTIFGTIVRDAHALEADRIGDEPSGSGNERAHIDIEEIPSSHPENPEILVIGKSPVWRSAEQHATRQVVNQLYDLVRQGCTRTQALDYFMIKQQNIRDLTQTEWAGIAGCEQPTISNAVTEADRIVNTPDIPLEEIPDRSEVYSDE